MRYSFNTPQDLPAGIINTKAVQQAIADALNIDLAAVQMSIDYEETPQGYKATRIDVDGPEGSRNAIKAVLVAHAPAEDDHQERRRKYEDILDPDRLVQILRNARQKIQQLEARIEALENA